MTEEFVKDYLIPIATFVFSVGVIYEGIRRKLISIQETNKLITDGLKNDITTLRIDMIHRIESSCNRCKERDASHKHTHEIIFEKLDMKADK